MNWKRLRLVLLAIVLVFIGTNIIVSIPFQRIYQGVVNPHADADDVIELLQDADTSRRLLGLDAYHIGLNDDIDLQKELLIRVTQDSDIEVRQRAMNLLASKASAHPFQTAENPPLAITDIDQIVALLEESNTTIESMKTDEMKFLDGLINFSGYTAKWQSQPMTTIARLTQLLEQTTAVPGEEHYAGIYRQERRRLILQALKGYAHKMMLPQYTLDKVLTIYSDKKDFRMREEAAYVLQYHAINGPLPEAARQAVVDTMINNPGRQLQLVAIMTMEWIGKQEGRIPPELLEQLETESDPDTRNSISHVILRMQKDTDDPAAALLDVAMDRDKPVSLRVSALSNATLQHGKDPRVSRALLLMTSDDEPLVRANVTLRLPNDPIDNSNADMRTSLLPYLDKALNDPDPSVRVAAVNKLRVFKLSDEDKLKRLEKALLDSDDKVFIQATEVVRQTGLHSQLISEQLAERSELLDRAGKRSAELTQQQIHQQNRGPWQTIVETAKDTRQHGLRLFWVLAALGIIVAAGFAINYVYQLLMLISDQQRHKFMVLGVLVVWTILTYVMVGIFVLGAFSFGHNSLVPPKDQFIIDAVMGSALLIYTLTGWGMRRLILRKTNTRK